MRALSRSAVRVVLAAIILLSSSSTTLAQRDLALPEPGEPASVSGDMLRTDNTGADGQVLSKVQNPSTHKMDFRWITPQDAQVYMSTVGDVSGNVTLFMSPTTSDQTESRVQVRVGSDITLDNLYCVASAAPSENITITGRVGACGSLGDDGDMACTILASATTCDDTDNMAVSNGQCYAFKITFGGALSSNVVVTCWADQS